MNIEIQSDKIQNFTIEHKTVTIDNCIEVKEKYVDGELQSQEWKTRQGFAQSHPEAYEPELMHFAYYEDISFLESLSCVNYMDYYQEIPEPTFITDWSTFKGLDHVVCIHLGMDGCIYQINKPEPISLWRRKDYIAGFQNNEFKLKWVMEQLETIDWIRNIEIVDIPYYNQHDGATQAVEFEYRLPSEKELIRRLNKVCPDTYFGEI